MTTCVKISNMDAASKPVGMNNGRKGNTMQDRKTVAVAAPIESTAHLRTNTA